MNNILFFTLIFSAVVFSQSTSIFRDIFLLDCTGTVHFFPDPEDSIAAANGFEMREVYSYAIDTVLERVECVCGEVDRTEVLALIPGTMDFFFNTFAGEEKVTEITDCPDVLTQFAVEDGPPTVIFPDTCDWKNDRECLLQADLGLGVIFDVAILECPESHLPLMSLGCSGPACDRLFMPCLSDSECGETLTCQEILDNDVPQPTVQNITDFFSAVLLAEGDCLSEQDFWMSLADFIRREAFDNTVETTTFAPKFCLPSVLSFQMNDQDFNEEFAAATRFEECELEIETYYACHSDQYCDYNYDDCEQSRVDSPEECEPFYYCNEYDYDLQECLEISCYEYDVYPNNETCLRQECQYKTYDEDGVVEGVCEQYEYQYDNLQSIDCYNGGDGPLSSWDGEKDSDLGNVHDWIVDSPFFVPPRTLEPLTEGAIPLFRSDCEGTIQFLPNTPMGVSAAFHRFINMYNWIYETARERFDCEIGEDNDEMFSVHHFLTTFAFLPTSDLETFESFRDLPLDTYGSYFFSNNWNISLPDGSVGAYFFEFPETCDWESWTTNGVCAFTYEGLSSLISLDINFNVRLDQCENDFPALYVECTGDDCNLMKGIVACTPEDSDSCANAECWTIDESLEQFWPTSYDEFGEPVDGEIYDIIAELIGVYSDECFAENNEQIYQDWNNLLILMGLDEEATHVCIPDLSAASENELEWFETQWSLNEDDRIVLTDLKAWEAPEFPELPTESVGDTDFSALFVPSIIAFLGFSLL